MPPQNDERDQDLTLTSNQYAYIADSTSGLISTYVGPFKLTLTATERPMVFDRDRKEFVQVNRTADAKKPFIFVDERSYVVLHNPHADGAEKFPLVKSKNEAIPQLLFGNKVKLQGPRTFPLWPGQIATVVKGHSLRYNQYLVVEIYNEKEARENWAKASMSTTDAKQAEELKKEADKLTMGQQLIIRGDEVSFYIPPTGVEVLRDPTTNEFVRDAVTLERLEYCILLNENGDKRYVSGPKVVFPEPTETFVEKKDTIKFRAIELNKDMGLYIKVIADYRDDGKAITDLEYAPDGHTVVGGTPANHFAGDELFITGKDTKIYYPRAEHAIIKYDDQTIHYATVINKGEARYVLNKDTGVVSMVKGPCMLLPDPRNAVIVRRVLTEKEVNLWYPGNQKAQAYNAELRKLSGSERYVPDTAYAMYASASPAPSSGGAFAALSAQNARSRSFGGQNVLASAEEVAVDAMSRKTKYTPPRTITLDTKYDGVPSINVFPGYAVQVIDKAGARRVVQGPSYILLDYDETLAAFALSTGKPKDDHNLKHDVYLQVKFNRVSDIIEAETIDLVNVNIRVNYRINFEGNPDNWFLVDNYVKFMTQHCRSRLRAALKKVGIRELSQKRTEIIRDTILGVPSDGKPRPGMVFPENGMHVYDCEVLEFKIGDSSINSLLTSQQINAVGDALKIENAQRAVETTTRLEEATRLQLVQTEKTKEAQRIALTAQRAYEAGVKEEQLELAKTESLAKVEVYELEHKATNFQLNYERELRKIERESEADAHVKIAGAITEKMAQAIITAGELQLAETLASSLPNATGSLGMIVGKNGLDAILASVNGTPIGRGLEALHDNGDGSKK